ncbi:MAG: hypothetical protein V4635_16205 [Bacteroidota bacterium]
MKRYISTLILALVFSVGVKAQESFGNALNIGLGVGYYGYYYAAPALNINYEFDVFKNFTLAPFAGISSYRHYRYWGDHNHYPYRNYYYRETIIPIGVKGSYYFDELFKAGEKWDFYGALSLGVAFRTVRWDNDYYGDREVRTYASPLFGSLHIGTEYHINTRTGLFLDLSTGYSTIGLGFHF